MTGQRLGSAQERGRGEESERPTLLGHDEMGRLHKKKEGWSWAAEESKAGPKDWAKARRERRNYFLFLFKFFQSNF
jgi:hypothetical protein